MTSSSSAGKYRFRETLSRLNAAQKPGVGVPAYTRWINRRVARVFAAGAVAVGITPNGVTALSALTSIVAIAILLYFPPTFLIGLLAAFLFALGYALDSADGQVARVTGNSSPAGEWLDHVVDAMRTPAMHLAILIGFIKYPASWPITGWQLWWLPLAFSVLMTGHFMSQILAEQLRKKHAVQEPSSGGNLRSFVNLHMDSGTFCWLFILWGTGWGFFVAYGLLFLANAATVLVSMRRKFVSLSTPQGA